MSSPEQQRKRQDSYASNTPLLESLQEVSRYVAELEWAEAADRVSKRAVVNEHNHECDHACRSQEDVQNSRLVHALDVESKNAVVGATSIPRLAGSQLSNHTQSSDLPVEGCSTRNAEQSGLTEVVQV
jgi:hypothetical protein